MPQPGPYKALRGRCRRELGCMNIDLRTIRGPGEPFNVWSYSLNPRPVFQLRHYWLKLLCQRYHGIFNTTRLMINSTKHKSAVGADVIVILLNNHQKDIFIYLLFWYLIMEYYISQWRKAISFIPRAGLNTWRNYYIDKKCPTGWTELLRANRDYPTTPPISALLHNFSI